MTHRVKPSEEGVYRFVKKLWDEGDLGHLWYAGPGMLRIPPITTGHGYGIFDWNPDIVDSGHLQRVVASDTLILSLRAGSRNCPSAIKKEIEEIQANPKPAPKSWRPPPYVAMTKKLRRELEAVADPLNRDTAISLTGREVAQILQGLR